ncbi:MAG: nicotinate phosphoribosyltransferase [Candidatus Omnitrophica bacterium]|nr:nicotinate phosphoribosyltransferase [Candidatus Omnitrophota bacterium]MCM8792915.1 nicotinate phosphoribosyltransferase [Candidatus Omnitrophota bacterium]
MFHIATAEEIREGEVTDVYFQRTKEILEKEKIRKQVKAEFCVKKFPERYSWGVLAGIEEVAKLLEGKTGINVDCFWEGTIFGQNQPVMVIEGEYTEFGIYETALLGFLCQASGIATKAARCKKTAGERILISFGVRRMHPAIAPMIERSAFIGGCDGVAGVKSAEILGIEPMGTMPHALVLLLGDVVKAAQSFHKIMDKKIKRIALIDTFSDEKFEAIRVAEVLGKDLYGVRLDTPASRRGDFLGILKEVRWELDLRGFKDIKIIVSGGINEEEILALNSVCDGYGVGTAISNAQVLDFAMDIVEIEGKPLAKRGKFSGAKKVLRCPKCFYTEIVPASIENLSHCGKKMENLLKPLIRDGKLVRNLPKPQEIRNYVLSQLDKYLI